MDIDTSILAYLKALILLCEGCIEKNLFKKQKFLGKKKKFVVEFMVKVNGVDIHNVTEEYLKKFNFMEKRTLVESHSKIALAVSAKFFDDKEFRCFKEIHKIMIKELDEIN